MVDVRGDVLRPPHGTTPAASLCYVLNVSDGVSDIKVNIPETDSQRCYMDASIFASWTSQLFVYLVYILFILFYISIEIPISLDPDY